MVLQEDCLGMVTFLVSAGDYHLGKVSGGHRTAIVPLGGCPVKEFPRVIHPAPRMVKQQQVKKSLILRGFVLLCFCLLR